VTGDENLEVFEQSVFATACRLIAHAQNGVSPSPEAVLTGKRACITFDRRDFWKVPTSLPYFQMGNENPPPMDPHEALFDPIAQVCIVVET